MRKFLLVMFFVMCPVLAHGATYYVATTGSDSTSCANAQSQSTPKLTINAGIGCLSSGDTLIVKAGIYNEIIPDNIPSGTAGTPTTVKSEVQYGAVLRPDGSQSKPDGVGFVIFGWTGDRSYITFDGFVLDAVDMPAPVYITYIKNGDNHHITISNNEMKNAAHYDDGTSSDGFVLGHTAHEIVFRGNKIHDIGTGASSSEHFFSYCSYFTGQNSVFENNELYNCSGFGLHMYDATGLGSNNNIVRNNYIHDNGGQGILFASGGQNNLLYNNIIVHNGIGPAPQTGGIQVGGYGSPSANNGVYNNTVYNNNGNCIEIGGNGPSDNTIRNNICYQNSNDNVVVSSGSGNTIDHNLLGTNPLFVNATAQDFHLQAGSPAIYAGVVIPGLPYCGSAPTLGALDRCGLPAPTNLRLVVN